MPYPTTIVEIAFDDGPYVASPTWTAVTSYVRNISISRGRDSDQTNFEAGTATVVLDNRDRRFDPFYTAGTYYGKLLPRRQIRIRATVSSTTYDVFRGYVDGWPVELSEAGYDSTVTLSCFDVLGLLATEEMPDDLAGAYITSLSPRHYWPLDDPINASQTTNVTLRDLGSLPVPINGFVNFTGNVPGLADGLPNTAIVNAFTGTSELTGTITTVPSGSSLTMTAWWQRPQGDTGNIVLISSGGQWIQTAYDRTLSRFTVKLNDPITEYEFRNNNVALDTSSPHHIAVVAVATGSPPYFTSTPPTLYIDGIEFTMTYIGSSFKAIQPFEAVNIGRGRFQQITVFPSALTATQIRNIYNLSANRVLESTSDRFTRIMGYTSVPGSLDNYDGTASYQVFDIGAGGPPINQELQLLADSENGNVFVTSAGVLTMTSRNSIFSGNSLTSVASFGDTGITIEPILRYEYNDDSILNDVTVGFTGDGGVTVQDSNSISTYGQKSASITTYVSTPEQAEDMAELIVGFSSTPKIAINEFRVNVDANNTSWATILGLELLNRLTVVIQQRTGANISTQQILQGIRHEITPGEWQTSITTSTRYTNPFVLDSSLLDGTDLLI